MSSGTQTPSRTARPRRLPLWPWLLMPLVTLLIFYALRSARDLRVPPPAPGAALQSVAPDEDAAPSQR